MRRFTHDRFLLGALVVLLQASALPAQTVRACFPGRVFGGRVAVEGCCCGPSESAASGPGTVISGSGAVISGPGTVISGPGAVKSPEENGPEAGPACCCGGPTKGPADSPEGDPEDGPPRACGATADPCACLERPGRPVPAAVAHVVREETADTADDEQPGLDADREVHAAADHRSRSGIRLRPIPPDATGPPLRILYGVFLI